MMSEAQQTALLMLLADMRMQISAQAEEITALHQHINSVNDQES